MMATPDGTRDRILRTLARTDSKVLPTQLDKQPSWVRRLIAELARQAEDATIARDEALGSFNVDPADVIGGTVQAYRVPRRRYIYVGERWTSDLRVRFDNAAQLEVTANGPLQIVTRAANVAVITEANL
jgi:hypothetical protein